VIVETSLTGGVDGRFDAQIVFNNLSAIMADALLANNEPVEDGG